MEYIFELDKRSNGILIREKDSRKLITMVAIPPGNGCFLIRIGNCKYECNFEGLVLIRTDELDMLYRKGILEYYRLKLKLFKE